MNIINLINKITKKNTPFILDIRYSNQDQIVVIIILKSLEEDICFEPLIITANKNEIDDILPEKLEEHYEKVKNDINDVEKFLGKKTMIQTKIIQEKVKDTHVSSNDFDIDLDF